MQRVQLNRASGVPVFRQVIDQIVFMIEAGELRDGDRLPSSRLLATNLNVNRNTTARAYAELSRLGYLQSKGRGGMVVRRSAIARQHFVNHEAAVSALAAPIRECLDLGMSADEIAVVAYQVSLHVQHTSIRVALVECNEERAKSFASELSETISATVAPLLLRNLVAKDLVDVDLVVTTFFHNTELRRRIRDLQLSREPEVLAIVATPHIKTLGELSRLPKGRRIGVLYYTFDQAEEVAQSLINSGLEGVVALKDIEDAKRDGCDVLVIPNDSPGLRGSLGDRHKIVEFGNFLDPASKRMVSEFVDELRDIRTQMASYAEDRTSPDDGWRTMRVGSRDG